MIDDETLPESIEVRIATPESRREFFRRTSGIALGLTGASLLASCGDDTPAAQLCPAPIAVTPTPTATASPTPTPTATASPTPTPTARAFTQAQALNFLLNIAYLKGQFYSIAVNGAYLAASVTGSGAGTVTGGSQVPFATGDAGIKKVATEIATNEIAQITALRNLIGTTAVAMPNINIANGGSTNGFGAFSTAGGVPAGDAVNPYFGPDNFFFGAILFQDLSVTAYAGVMQFMTDATVTTTVANLMGASAYHAAMARLTSSSRTSYSIDTVNNYQVRNVLGISNARDTLDGTGDDDEGIEGTATETNIVPAANGGTFARTPQQVLNILYANRGAVALGAFFPNGVNGDIKTSAAGA